MTLTYLDHYFNQPALKRSFEEYANHIFGLDFSRWKEKGLWDERYTAFSAFDGERCVSSMCTYRMGAMIDGVEKTCLQLLTVGTLEPYRKRGIQRKLWSKILNYYPPGMSYFLFTEEDAAGFYQKLGFKRVDEYSEVIKLDHGDVSSTNFLRLNMDQDEHYQIAYRISGQRTYVSDQLGFKALNLLMFMFLYVYRDKGYYLPDLDCIVIVEEQTERLQVHDVIARDMPDFESLKPFFTSFGKGEIEFLFHAEKLNIPKTVRHNVSDGVLLVHNLVLPIKPIIPFSTRA